MSKEFLNIALEEIEDFAKDIDTQALEAARDVILNAEHMGGRVHITGIGKPSYVAGYTASLMSSTGTKAYTLDGTEAVHGSSGQVAENDVVIAISNSGQTRELRATVEALKRNGARVIAVTGNKDSWLAQASDVALIAKVKREGDSLNKPPRASILVEIMMLQSLSVLLQEHRGLTPTDYVKWHPGGSLGDSVREEIEKNDN